MKQKRKIKDDFNLMTILIIPIAIAINFICGSLVLALKLPVYLDCIGTFLISMLSGPWVGLVTGILSICINAVSDPTLLPYSLVAGVLGAMIGGLAAKKMFTSIVRIVISVFFVSLVAMILGITIAVVFFGGFDTSGSSLIAAALISGGIPFWPSQMISSLITEVPDKILSILIPFFVVQSMSPRYLYKFSNGNVFIEAKRKKERRKAMKQEGIKHETK